MEKVSLIIPGRCEPYFQRTIDSACERARGNYEIIAVVDGPGQEPLKAPNGKTKIIVLEKSIGQRAAYNLGVENSTGHIVGKIDAHALMSEGWDVEIEKNCPEDAIVLPEMRNLDVKLWKEKIGKGKRTWFMNFGLDLYCHYWSDYKKRPEAQVEFPEVMTGQGSSWFTTRKWNDHIGLLDEGVGSWGNVGIEVSLRTWLCGGRQLLNKNIWQAHWFRRDDGGFTYPMDGRKVHKAHKYTWDNYYFKDNAFKNQTRPFKWIIEKFAPVPGWEVYLKDEYKIKRTIIYYTDHNMDEGLAKAIRKNLQKVAVKIPIISVSQRPLNFGRNICVGIKTRSNRSIYEQILVGLEAAAPESIIYLCEHDVAYTPSHFAHLPGKDKDGKYLDRIEYNQNRYYWAPGQTEYLPARGKWPLSQIVCKREFLMEQVKNILSRESEPSSKIRCRDHRFMSERPNVDIRHGMNFSQDGAWKKAYYKGHASETVSNIGHWGSPAHFTKKIGWTGVIEETISPLFRLLREHYGLDRSGPPPTRIKGFHRIDVSKVMNMLGLKRGAEIGVRGGHHSEIICKEIKDVDLLCIDTWEGAAEEHYEPAKKRLEKYNTKIIKKSSMSAVLDVPDESLDFVYIDADHSWDYVMEDLIAWNRKVKPGGMIAGHDYDRAHKRGVVPAVDEYTKRHHIYEWYLTDQVREASFFWIKR